MLSMDTRDMRLMYKAFNEWQKNTLVFIKKGNENVPCNIIDKGLFESTVCFDGGTELEYRVVPTECLIDDSRKRKRALKRINRGIDK